MRKANIAAVLIKSRTGLAFRRPSELTEYDIDTKNEKRIRVEPTIHFPIDGFGVCTRFNRKTRTQIELVQRMIWIFFTILDSSVNGLRRDNFRGFIRSDSLSVNAFKEK